MRKTRISTAALESSSKSEKEWLDLEAASVVEVTSEDPNYPIEFALAARGPGWRAAVKGEQIIREFSEAETERTQEFTLRWARKGEPPKEIVRQQWNFSPHGSTREVEDYP